MAKQLAPQTIKWRRYLHSIPEESFKELKTAAYLAERLASFGYEVETGVAGTGVVANLGKGRTVCLRAEMDGLPIQEINRVEYISQNAGLMHACGHDANMACVLTAAQILKELALPARIRIVMQPASEKTSSEDKKSGSNKMIDAGALMDADAILSLHVDPTIACGLVGLLCDVVKDRNCLFSIAIEACEEKANPDWRAMNTGAQVVAKLFSEVLVHKTYSPLFSLSSLESVASDSTDSKAFISGNFRYLGRETHEFFKKMLESSLLLVESLGGKAILEIEKAGNMGSNSLNVAAIVKDAVFEITGKSCLEVSRQAWSEDFTPYSSLLPAALVFLGVGVIGQPRGLHTASFELDESGLECGVAVLVETVVRLADQLK